MELPRTIAMAVDPETAKSIVCHIEGALEAGAGTILLYTTLEKMVDDPQDIRDFPAPDVTIFQTVYVIGANKDFDDYQAQVSEYSGHIDKEED
jgi:hypothetical protein